jgi:UrcA family protein
MKNHALALIAIGLMALSGTSASAQSALDVEQVKVSTAGLDITTEAGARTLLRRIEHAAAQVCGGEPSSRMDRVQKFRPCTKEVVNRTVSEINAPTVTAVYEGRSSLVMAQQTSSQ